MQGGSTKPFGDSAHSKRMRLTGQVVLQNAPLAGNRFARSFLSSGGTLVNSGTIDELIYDGGIYDGQEGSSVGTWFIGSADTTAGIFGLSIIDNLAFSDDGFVISSINDNSTPEPATMLIVGLGLTGLAISRRLRRKK